MRIRALAAELGVAGQIEFAGEVPMSAVGGMVETVGAVGLLFPPGDVVVRRYLALYEELVRAADHSHEPYGSGHGRTAGHAAWPAPSAAAERSSRRDRPHLREFHFCFWR